MPSELQRVIEQVGKDKGIDTQILIEALEAAMVKAAEKNLGLNQKIEAHFNEEAGEVELFEFKNVVESVTDGFTEIQLEEAQKLDPEAQIGDCLGLKLDSHRFGRIAAQSARQVIIQKIREAEREIIYEEYKDRKGEVVNGIVRRFEKGDAIVDLGRAEGVLQRDEQIPREAIRPGDRVRAYVKDVQREVKGPQIILSRSSKEFLLKLFELEVPEIAEGIVTIDSLAREPGGRSKVAVVSRDSDVDPVGACVGVKGSRVQSVVQELRGEKIDIVPWNPDPAKYVCNALQPAVVSRVIMDEAEQLMEIIVPDDQLSLAIGRRGQNVRLAVILVGWKIDIQSETQAEQKKRLTGKLLSLVEGIDNATAQLLFGQGIGSIADLAEVPADMLSSLPGINAEQAEAIRKRAADIAASGEAPTLEQFIAEEEEEKRKAEEEAQRAAAEAEAQRAAAEEEAQRAAAEAEAQRAAAEEEAQRVAAEAEATAAQAEGVESVASVEEAPSEGSEAPAETAPKEASAEQPLPEVGLAGEEAPLQEPSSVGTEAASDEAQAGRPIQSLHGVGEKLASALAAVGINTVADLAARSPESLAEIEGIGKVTAEKLLALARGKDS